MNKNYFISKWFIKNSEIKMFNFNSIIYNKVNPLFID